MWYFFVPTGYQSVEKYFNTKVMEEHQIGEYLYDLQVPNFELIPSGRVSQGVTDYLNEEVDNGS